MLSRLVLLLIAGSSSMASTLAQGAPPPAQATTSLLISDSLPESQYFENTLLNTTLSYSIDGIDAVSSTNSLTSTLSSTGSSRETSSGILASESEAQLNYFYDIVNVPTTDVVPIHISFHLEATRALPAPETRGDPASEARITFYQNTAGGMIITDEILASAGAYPSGNSEDVSGTYNTEFNPGESSGEIALSTQASSFGGPNFASSSSAFADPYIYIDPAYLAAHPDATLEISEGVGNVAPVASVPEPATWLLLCTGFGSLGFMLRRGRGLVVNRTLAVATILQAVKPIAPDSARSTTVA